MISKRFLAGCPVFLLLISLACSSDNIPSTEPVEERPEVNITMPVDADGLLNKIEANAVVVEGTSNLADGYIVTVRLSDGENLVGGTGVVNGGKWATESMAINSFHNGEITVTADGTNEEGTLSNTAETSLYLDQEPPSLNIDGPIAEDDKIDPDEATAVVVTGTSDAADDQVVLITFGDHTATYLTTEAKINNGQWEAKVDVSSLKSGSIMLMAEVSDLAGNPATVQRSDVILE